MKQKKTTVPRKKTDRPVQELPKHQELQELSHEAVPGYRNAFYIVFAAGAAYLALILLATL